MLRERGVDIFRMKGVMAIKGCESAPHCSTQREASIIGLRDRSLLRV